MTEFNDSKVMKSDFNEAGFQISRLNALYSLCNVYSRKGNLQEWKWTLDCIWRELAKDAKKLDSKKKEGNTDTNVFKLEEINKKIVKAGKDKSNLYLALQDKDIFLRGLQDDAGKGSKSSEDYEDGFT